MSRRIPLVAGAVVVVLLLGWYAAVWRPASSASKAAAASKSAAVGLQQSDAGRLSALEAQRRTLPGEEAKLRTAEIAVPKSTSLDSVIDQINAIAVANEISWTNESETVGASSTGSALATTNTSTAGDSQVALTLAVAGTYPSMDAFIAELAQRPRLIVIDSVSYAPGAKTGVTVSITARAFYNPTPIPALPKVVGGT